MTTTTHTAAYRDSCLLPRAGLTRKQCLDILDWIKALTMEGRHLEASTLYQEYFGLV